MSNFSCASDCCHLCTDQIPLGCRHTLLTRMASASWRSMINLAPRSMWAKPSRSLRPLFESLEDAGRRESLRPLLILSGLEGIHPASEAYDSASIICCPDPQALQSGSCHAFSFARCREWSDHSGLKESFALSMPRLRIPVPAHYRRIQMIQQIEQGHRLICWSPDTKKQQTSQVACLRAEAA